MPSIPKLTQEGKSMVAMLDVIEAATKKEGYPHDPEFDKLRKKAKEIFKEKPMKMEEGVIDTHFDPQE